MAEKNPAKAIALKQPSMWLEEANLSIVTSNKRNTR